MSTFKKIFGNTQESKVESSIKTDEFRKLSKSNFDNFGDLLEQHGGLSFEKQQNFNELTGEHSWDINLNEGLIAFGDYNFPFEVIGSLSFNDFSWMWGWANEKSGIPANVLESSLKLKSIGEQNNIEKFVNRHFSVEEGFEHKMGLIVSGILNADAYFCANYGQGTMVVTIKSKDIPRIDNNRLEKVLTNFPQLISSIEINHKNAFLNYLIDRDFQIKNHENTIEGLKNGKVLVAEFDELNRLKNLNGKI